ncbi:hypothetical protein NHX12_011262 [Muraenolepis orangiensis]|uniref:C2H2-type domain-containing protein n=1 Tax=Muraenolepis orangiensis TaxID=630683 RepID=A0A9Q0I704_9TELE|nr:hypothetical protein NHX12_011262 [Muraenolepis orangiensis]
MDSLIRASVCEITKLFQETVNDYIVELTLNRKENDTLKLRLRLTENKLRNERKYGMGWAASRRNAGLPEDGFAQHEGYQPASLRLIKEALKMDPPNQNMHAGSRSHSEGELSDGPPALHPGERGGEEDEDEEWEMGSTEPSEGGMSMDELRGLETALRAERGRERAALRASDTVNPSAEMTPGPDGPPAPKYIGLDGLEQEGELDPQPPTLEREDLTGDHDRTKDGLRSGGSSVGQPRWAKRLRDGELAPEGLGEPGDGPEDLPYLSAPGSVGDSIGDEEEGAGDLLHFCTQCGGGFPSGAELEEHPCPLGSAHLQGGEPAATPFPCASCGNAFSHAWALKNHECACAAERPHCCELCGKRFTHTRSLERHQLVHTGERPHRCPQCGRSFSRLGNLERHQRIHTGERPYGCEACGKRFSRVEYLKRHQQIHSGDKANALHCTQCGLSFGDGEELKNHQCY